MTAFVLMCLVGASDNYSLVSRERCDVIEHNRFYDERGRLVFAQAIFYDWSPEHSRYIVRAWRLVKDANQVPERNWRTGGYTMTWMDGETLRKIEADSVRDSWTQFDPELAEREILPKEMRTELRKADEYIHLKLKQMSQP